jgi:DNA-binding HxlR family transcriptional regulator
MIGGKWKGKLLFILMKGAKRHGELRKLIPEATQRMLTFQLRELERDGLIQRKIYPESPPKVEYSVSNQGKKMKPVIDAMWDWGKKFLDTLPQSRVVKPKANRALL